MMRSVVPHCSVLAAIRGGLFGLPHVQLLGSPLDADALLQAATAAGISGFEVGRVHSLVRPCVCFCDDPSRKQKSIGLQRYI